MDEEENKLTTFQKLRKICCKFFSNNPSISKNFIENDLSKLLQNLLNNDCSDKREGGIISFDEEYEIKIKICEVLRKDISIIVLNEEESLLNLSKKIMEHSKLWISVNFGNEVSDYSFINNLLNILTKNYNKYIHNFSTGIKSIKTKEMMDNYISSIISFIPLLPNQIIILFNPIYWSLFVYNFLFSSMIKDKKFNIERFYESVDPGEHKFFNEFKWNKDSIISKLIMMRIDLSKKPDIDIKDSDKNIITELNIIMKNDYKKEFKNFHIDGLIPNKLILSIIGDETSGEYPRNKKKLIDSIIKNDNLSNEILIKFIIYIILSNSFRKENNPFPEAFIIQLRTEYKEFSYDVLQLNEKLIPNESILIEFKKLEETINNNNKQSLTDEFIDKMKLLYIKYKINEKDFPLIRQFYGSRKHVIKHWRKDDERIYEFIEKFRSSETDYGLSDYLIKRLDEIFIPYEQRHPSNVLNIDIRKRKKKIKPIPLQEPIEEEELIPLHKQKTNIMPTKEEILSILENKLKELFDQIYINWIHNEINIQKKIKTFYCKTGKGIIQSKFFNVLIGLCKDRYWTLTSNNVHLILHDYFDDIIFKMNNQNSLLFPENITLYYIKSVLSLIDIYISKQSFYHTLFDDNLYNPQLYIIEVFKKNHITYEYFYVKNNNKPIIAINNTDNLSLPQQLYIRNNLFSRLIGNHMNLNITDKLFEFFNNDNDSQKIIKEHVHLLFKPDTKIDIQKIKIGNLDEINQINIKKIYFRTLDEPTQKIILESTLFNNNFSKRIITTIPSTLQYNTPLKDLINILSETEVKFKNKKYDYSEISQGTKLIKFIEEEESKSQLSPIEMDIQEEEIGLHTKKLELMETKYSKILEMDQFKNINDLINYMKESNEKIFIAMNTLNNGGLVDSKHFNYFIKFQVHLLQFLCYHFTENPNFKDLQCDFQIICENKEHVVFQTEKHNIRLLSKDNKESENHFYDYTKYANIIISKMDMGDYGLGKIDIDNILTSTNIGSRFSRTNSCHFEKFFDIEDMFLLKTNNMLPYSPYDFLLLNQIECKKLQEKTILKPYNLLILHLPKSTKTEKEPESSKDKCKNVLLTTLNTQTEKFIKTNDDITNIYSKIRNEFYDFWNNKKMVNEKLKNTFDISPKTGTLKLHSLIGNKTKGKEKQGTFPILGEYLRQAIGTKNSGKPQQDKYSNKNYVANLFFDYFFLDELISTIEIKINFFRMTPEKIKIDETGFSKIFSVNDKNIVIQHANKGNDPFLTEFPFYDIEKKLFDKYFFESLYDSEELKSMVLKKIIEREKKEYYFKKEECIQMIEYYEKTMNENVINTDFIEAHNKYYNDIGKYYGQYNFETHQHNFQDTTPGDIIFYMLENLKYEYNKKFKEIQNYKQEIDNQIKNTKISIPKQQTLKNHVYYRVDLSHFKKSFESTCNYYKGTLITKLTQQYNEKKEPLFEQMLDYINSNNFININSSFNGRSDIEKEVIVSPVEYMDIDDKEIIGEEEEINILMYQDLRENDDDENGEEDD